MTTVIKISGHELDSMTFLTALAGAVATLPEAPIIVHGGGKALTTLLTQMGVETHFIEGLRVTDGPSLAAAEMVLRGQTNLLLVRTLVGVGLPALGLSGVDAGLIQAEKLIHPAGDLGFVGRPVGVKREALEALLGAGFLPVIAPIALGADGQTYNVNADHIAAAVAAALEAEQLIFLTNVEGVLINGERASTLTAAEVSAAIEDGTIFGGMVPKVRSALDALEQGVRRTVITNLAGLAELAGHGEAGTTILQTADSPTDTPTPIEERTP